MSEPTRMNGKPVIEVPAKGVINFDSGFGPKLLCDRLTFSLGSACGYSCAFCFVPSMMKKSPHLRGIEDHASVVIRRKGALDALRTQLVNRAGRRFADPADQRVIYSSPVVDCAANVDLADETVEACRIILELTNWHIRLLSKSNLLPRIARKLEAHRARMIFGVSTGTFDDCLARSFELGAAPPSKRIASLHQLQDEGFRTFGMICPSLPQRDYMGFAREARAAIRAERCEHVWAEVLNVRGESMTLTTSCLRAAGYEFEAGAVEVVGHDAVAWEEYARDTFLAHAAVMEDLPGKLRYLQYLTASNQGFWRDQVGRGAVLLGAKAKGEMPAVGKEDEG